MDENINLYNILQIAKSQSPRPKTEHNCNIVVGANKHTRAVSSWHLGLALKMPTPMALNGITTAGKAGRAMPGRCH